MFRETLQVLVAKFKHVFFVPGAAHLADTTLQHKTRSRTGSHSIKLRAMQPPCRVSTSGKEQACTHCNKLVTKALQGAGNHDLWTRRQERGVLDSVGGCLFPNSIPSIFLQQFFW